MASKDTSKGIIAGNAGSERRRSSQSSQKFAGLMAQKRNSGDATAAQRKASFDEMKPAPGFLGSMWNNFTKGTGPAKS